MRTLLKNITYIFWTTLVVCILLAPWRVLVLIQVVVASLKWKAPDKLSGTNHRKNKTKTNPLSRFDSDHLGFWRRASIIPHSAPDKRACRYSSGKCDSRTDRLYSFASSPCSRRHFVLRIASRCARGAICACLARASTDSLTLDYISSALTNWAIGPYY